VQFRAVIRERGDSRPYKSLPTTSNALVVRHLVIHQAATDVVLGFIGRTCWHPPDDDSDSIAGIAGWAFSLHGAKLLIVTDKLGLKTYLTNRGLVGTRSDRQF
jgi:hypothetical protein